MENNHSNFLDKEFQNQYQDKNIQIEIFALEKRQKFQTIKNQQFIHKEQRSEALEAQEAKLKQKNIIHLNLHQINNAFGTKTLESVAYAQSRFSLELNRPIQEDELKKLVRSPKQILKKFTNFIEFHSLRAQDIWEQQLKISIDEFIKRVHEKLGYKFANDEMIALMKVASKNPILEVRDFIKQEIFLDWKQSAEIMERRIRLNSRRRHEKNNQNLINSDCIQQKQQYQSYLETVQQKILSNNGYAKMIKRHMPGQVRGAFKKLKMQINSFYTQITQKQEVKKDFKISITQPGELYTNRNNSMKIFVKKQNFYKNRISYKYSASKSLIFQKGRGSNGINLASTNNRQKSQISRQSNNHLSTISTEFDPFNSFKISRMSAMMKEKQKELGLQNDINMNLLEKKWDFIVKTGQINRWLEEKEDPRRFKINNFPQKIEIIEENLATQQENIIPQVVFVKKYRSEAAQNQKRKISQSKKQNNAPPVLKKNSKNNLKGTVLMVLEEKDKLTKTNLHNRLQQRDQQLNFVLIQIMRTKSLFQQQHKILTQNLINSPNIDTSTTASNFA